MKAYGYVRRHGILKKHRGALRSWFGGSGLVTEAYAFIYAWPAQEPERKRNGEADYFAVVDGDAKPSRHPSERHATQAALGRIRRRVRSGVISTKGDWQ